MAKNHGLQRMPQPVTKTDIEAIGSPVSPLNFDPASTGRFEPVDALVRNPLRGEVAGAQSIFYERRHNHRPLTRA